MLKGLRTVGYQVADLKAATRWYSELLGYGPYFDEPFYVGFDVGGYELGLQPAGDEAPAGVGGDTAYWGVADVPGALEQLTAAGATVLQAAQDVGGGIVVGSVRDPFGNVLGVIDNPHFAPPLVATKEGEVAARVIELEREVSISADAAWALWATSEGIAAWWMDTCRVELRPGGFYEMYFMTDAPKGQQGSEGCRILSYLPGRMLSFTWNAPPHLSTRDAPTWVVLEFEPRAEGSSVRLAHLGWPAAGLDDADSDWPKTFAYFERAWTMVLDLFVKSITNKRQAP